MLIMKKLILFCLMITAFWSCSVDDTTEPNATFEILPILSAEMPETVRYNELYTISYTYAKPTTCHSFNDLYYISQGEFRTVAVITSVLPVTGNVVCESLSQQEGTEQGSFAFLVEDTFGTYIFKFWQGVNEESGEDQYLVFEVPIEQ